MKLVRLKENLILITKKSLILVLLKLAICFSIIQIAILQT